MKKERALITVIGIVCILLIVVGSQMYGKSSGSAVMTKMDAIALVKKEFPAYKDYPSENLPPKSVEVVEDKDGFRVGMYVEGSGVKGIIKAECFLVTKDGVVTETGFFHGEGPAQSMNLLTCTPKE